MLQSSVTSLETSKDKSQINNSVKIDFQNVNYTVTVKSTKQDIAQGEPKIK